MHIFVLYYFIEFCMIQYMYFNRTKLIVPNLIKQYKTKNVVPLLFPYKTKKTFDAT